MTIKTLFFILFLCSVCCSQDFASDSTKIKFFGVWELPSTDTVIVTTNGFIAGDSLWISWLSDSSGYNHATDDTVKISMVSMDCFIIALWLRDVFRKKYFLLTNYYYRINTQ